MQENLVIGAKSEIKVMDNVSTFGEGAWLVEDHLYEKSEVLIARAVQQRGITIHWIPG